MSPVSETSWVTVYIGLGTNVGDRVDYLRKALSCLRQTEAFCLTRVSSFYETEPVGLAAQGLFLNGALEGKTSLSPEALWAALQAIEKKVGRIRRVRWGPREIDLDLLFYGDKVIQTPSLTLPHPRLHERDFVLVALAELCPAFIHPTLKKSVKDLLAGCASFDASDPKPYPIAALYEAV